MTDMHDLTVQKYDYHQRSVCNRNRRQCQALRMRELELRFRGQLPAAVDDECRVCTRTIREREDPLKEGECVKALCFDLNMPPACITNRNPC